MIADPSKITTVIDTVRGMTSREIAVMIVVVLLFVSGAFWVENRYAKLTETQERIERHQAQLIQVQTQILEVINAQSPEVQAQIRQRSREFVEHINAITRANSAKKD